METSCICKFCGKSCKNENSHRNHERLCPKNPDRKYVSHTIGHKAWNKGLTKDTDERIRKSAEIFSKRYKGTELGKLRLGHPCSEEHKAKMRDIAFRRHLGGWHTSRSIEYNGIKLDSEYELMVAKELDSNGIKWERPSYFLWTDDSGIEHRYYPDFYLKEYEVYLDPKNDYLINNKSARFGITDREKISIVEKQNGIRILILDKDHLLWENIQKLL